MKPFEFRLQSVRLVRELAEQRAREALSQATDQLQAAARDLQAARAAVRATAAALCAERESGRFAGAPQAMGLAAMTTAQQRTGACEQQFWQAREAHGQALAAWQSTRQGLKVLDRLEERERREHARAEQRAEQQQLDEYAGLAMARAALAR